MSKVEEFGRLGLVPSETWPVKGLKRYLQVIMILMMRYDDIDDDDHDDHYGLNDDTDDDHDDLDDVCQDKSKELGLSLSLLFLSQTEQTRSRSCQVE